MFWQWLRRRHFSSQDSNPRSGGRNTTDEEASTVAEGDKEGGVQSDVKSKAAEGYSCVGVNYEDWVWVRSKKPNCYFSAVKYTA